MAFTAGVPAALQPTQTKTLYSGNYIDFTAAAFDQWTQQFLPDVYEKEAEIYGNRSIGSFLRMVSAEMPSASDEIRWVEQGRLHIRYDNVAVGSVETGGTAGVTPFTITFGTNPDGASAGSAQVPAIRVGQTIMVQGQDSNKVPQGAVLKE